MQKNLCKVLVDKHDQEDGFNTLLRCYDHHQVRYVSWHVNHSGPSESERPHDYLARNLKPVVISLHKFGRTRWPSLVKSWFEVELLEVYGDSGYVRPRRVLHRVNPSVLSEKSNTGMVSN